MGNVSVLLPLLTEDSKVVLPHPDDPFLLAAVAAVALCLLVLALFVFVTRPRHIEAGPVSMDLGEEPPAVVNLLFNTCRITPNAVPATLLDLAARGFLEIEEYGTENVICRLRHNVPDTNLEPYAKRVLEHVKSEAVNGVVPVQALTTGTTGKSAAWWTAFSNEVQHDAEARRLIQDRWSKPMWQSHRLIGLVAGGLVILVAARANALEFGIGGVLVTAAFLHSALIKLFGKYQPSADGAQVISRWLGVREFLDRSDTFENLPPGAVTLWDRYMSYSAALGLARSAVRALPMGVEDDRRAWSAYGGEWREVRITYPHFRVIWGRTPVTALAVGLAITAAGGGALWLASQAGVLNADFAGEDELNRWVHIIGLTVAATGLAVVAWGLRTAWLALLDVGSNVEVNGEIVRCRAYTENDKPEYFLALADGRASQVRAWRVQASLYHRCHEGSIIKAVVCPRLGYVRRLEIVPAVAK